MSWGKASVPVPHWQLAGFDRQMIKANQTRTFTMTITGEQMAIWVDSDKGWQVEPGMRWF